jgi:DNA-directed RNA polymerase subunit RPC12/RpoP
MAFPIKSCAICGEEFELKPGKPGFATHCPECSESQETDSKTRQGVDATDRSTAKEVNEARREAMRNLLYRKDS